MSLSFGAMEITAVKKAAAMVAKAALTGPGPGAGIVDRPIKASVVPGLERRKRAIASADMRRFTKEVVARTSPPIARAGQKAVEDAVERLMKALPSGRIDMQMVLDLDMRPEALAERLLAGLPATPTEVDEAVEPVVRIIVEKACEHIVEFFTRRENYTTAAITHLVAQGGERFPADEVTEVLTDYSALIRKKFSQMRLFGLDLGYTDRSLDLMTGFVDLTIETELPIGAGEVGRQAVISSPRGPSRSHRIEWNHMGALVEERGRVLLEGPAGAGKSTLLQQLTLLNMGAFTLDEADGRSLDAGAGRTVPFLIRLREFVDGERLDLPSTDRLLATLAPGIGRLLDGWERNLLRTGNAAVYIDGVDELPEPLRPRALEWLTELVALYPNAYFVITSRAAGINDRWRSELRRLDFTSAVINPMSTAQVTTFIDRWHEAAGLGQPGSEADDSGAGADAESLKQAIRSRRDLARIATTPLLCAMICALHRTDYGVLPLNRTALYDRAFAMFFEKRDSHQKIRTYPVGLSREQVERFLTEFALWMLLERRRNIPRHVALNKVAGVLPMLRFKGAPRDWHPTPENMLQYLVERSGVLQEPTMEELEFRHPSFQDYLAAKRVFQEDHLELLIANAHDPLYQDVAVMAVGQAQNDPALQSRLLKGLMNRSASEPEKSRQLSLLALACIADVGMVDVQWADTIQHQTEALLPPRDHDEARALAAGDFVLDLLADVAEKHRFTNDEASASVKIVALINPDDPTSTGILRTLTEDTRLDVRADLVDAWHRSKDPAAFQAQVLGGISFHGTLVTIAGGSLLPFLPGLTNIERLTLVGLEGVTGQDLQELPHLSRLGLRGSRGFDLASLATVPNITSLALYGDGDPRTAGLANAPDVNHLSLFREGSLNQSAFNGLMNVIRLELGPDFRMPLQSLTQLPKLSSLMLYQRSVKDLWELADVHGITRFGWHNPYFANMTYLRPLEQVTHLAVHRHVATDLELIAAMPNLEELYLMGRSEVDLSPLADAPSLRRLVLTTLDGIDGAALEDLAETVDVRLRIDGSEGIRGFAVTHSVAELELISAAGLNLRGLARLPNIRSLTLDVISPAQMAALPSLSGITELTLYSAVGVDLALLAANPHLTSVTFHHAAGVDLRVLEANPRLAVNILGPEEYW